MNAPVANTAVIRDSMCAAALEVLPDIVILHDEERILFANAACRRFLGASRPEELEGHALDTIVHPDARAAGQERRRLLLDGDRPLKGIPVKLVTLDGELRHLTVDAHPLIFDGVKAALVVAAPSAG